HDHAIGKLELLEHGLCAFGHALVLLRGLLRRGYGYELDLVKLMLADHAARVLARGACLSAEARCPGGYPQGELRRGDHVLAPEICERYFCCGDKPIRALVPYFVQHEIKNRTFTCLCLGRRYSLDTRFFIRNRLKGHELVASKLG